MGYKNDQKVIALLPLKRHSERVPKKNFRIIAGKPLYEHILTTLLKVPEVSKVVINTDAKDLLKSIHNWDRVTIIDRPDNLCGDFVEMNKIIEHDVNYLSGDYFLQTHTTNPLVKPGTISAAIKSFFEKQDEFDSLVSVNKHQNRFYDEKMTPINHKLSELKRTQDLPPIYEENSNFYIFSKSSFELSGGKRIGKVPQLFIVDKMESFDIDDNQDYKIVEALLDKKC